MAGLAAMTGHRWERVREVYTERESSVGKGEPYERLAVPPLRGERDRNQVEGEPGKAMGRELAPVVGLKIGARLLERQPGASAFC